MGLLFKHWWLQALMISDAWGLSIFLGSLFLFLLLFFFLLGSPRPEPGSEGVLFFSTSIRRGLSPSKVAASFSSPSGFSASLGRLGESSSKSPALLFSAPFSFFSLAGSSMTSFPSSSLLPSAFPFLSPSPSVASGSGSGSSTQLFFWED